MTDKLLKIGIKAMKSIKKAYRQDRDHLVRLEQPVKVCRLAETVYGHAVPDWHGRLLDIADRVVTILPPEPGEETCDGASFCPDRIDALDLDLAPSYLTHDAGTEEMDAMAEDPAWIAAGWTQPELRRLWDDLLGMMVRRQAEALKGWKRLAGNGLARVMRSAVRALGGIMHGHLSAILAAALLAVAGCSVPPDDTVVDEWFWAPHEKVSYTVVQRSEFGSFKTSQDPATPPAATSGNDAGAAESGSSNDPATGGSVPEDGASSGVAGSSSSVVLDFRFGGFKGGGSKEDSRCRLSSPKISADFIRYKWETKAPSDWARNRTEKGALVVACAFYWSGDRWIGGKFDWTDESRDSRSCENIHGGYGGWDASAWRSAKRRAFCVVSADGKWRSNLIED